jgi:chemotaxis protein methyltransferase CheR
VGLERLNPQQFERFESFIYAQSGIRIDNKKVTLLSNRVRRRLSASGFANFDDYYQFLTSPQGADEISGFLDAITTNETFFFRTPKQFEWFRDEWLPEIVSDAREGRRAASARIWSAGCANGAEPYSIAICLAENAYRLKDWSLEVLGTDISQDMLTIARDGSFKQRSIDGVSESQLRRFFHHKTGEDLWQVNQQVRDRVTFRHHNLMEPIKGGEFDCIFIRNVLIYFDAESKRMVVRNLIKSLRDGGYLVVGPSEGIYDLLQPLQRVSPLIYRKIRKSPVGQASQNVGGMP